VPYNPSSPARIEVTWRRLASSGAKKTGLFADIRAPGQLRPCQMATNTHGADRDALPAGAHTQTIALEGRCFRNGRGRPNSVAHAFNGPAFIDLHQGYLPALLAIEAIANCGDGVD